MSGITVRLPEALRGGAQETLRIDGPVADVGELLKILESRVKDFDRTRDELFTIAVNGELVLHGESARPLAPGDEVEIVIAFAGG